MTVSTFAFSARTTFKRALVDEDIFLAMMGKHVKVRLNFDKVSVAVFSALATLTLFDRLAGRLNFIDSLPSFNNVNTSLMTSVVNINE